MTPRHMTAHDQLPREVRVMLANLKFNFNAEHVLIMHQQGMMVSEIKRRLLAIENNEHERAVRAGVVAP